MTSNALIKNNSLGFKKKDVDISILEEVFSKEFLNRVDEVIMFKELNKDYLKKIAESKSNLSQERIEELLLDYDTHLGARLLTRKISQYV